jgi:hypothetical protein
VADQTPLERIDSAIEQFLRETDQLQDGAFVTGWVLSASKARIQSDDESSLPLVTGATYALGPQTSTALAAGLVKFLDVIEKATWRMLSEDDEDEQT